jgi:hypothetical protein
MASIRTEPPERFVAAELAKLGLIPDPACVTSYRLEFFSDQVNVHSTTIAVARGEMADTVAGLVVQAEAMERGR